MLVARQLCADFNGPAERLVHWRLLAGDEPSASELMQAAGEAQRQGDVTIAQDLARRAHGLGDSRAALLLAEMTSATGDRVGAARVLEELLERETDDEIRSAGALELATLNLWNLGRPERAVVLAEHVVATTAGSPWEAVGCGALGAMLAYTGHCAEAMTVVEPHLDRAGPGRMLCCQVASTALAVRGAGGRAVAHGRAGLDLAVDAAPGPGDLDPEIHVVSLALALELTGAIDEADALTDEWYARAADRSVHHAWIALARSRVMLVRGDLGRAARFAMEAAAIFGDLDNHAPRRWAVAAHLLAAAQQGDLDTVGARQEELDALGPSGVSFLDTEVERARIWAETASGHLDRARARLIDTAQRAEGGELFALAANAWHDVIRLNGNGGAAARLLALEGKVDGPLMGARAAHAAALEAGDPSALLEASRSYADIGAALYAAEVAAQAVIRSQRHHDRGGVRAATAELRELVPLCAGARTPLLVDVTVAELSPREREVARLAATGLTSKQIGERLELSVRTVDNLLQRTYTKLGVAGRRELPEVLGRAEPP
jgi:DNA-binding CsgD family transcriptional regulator